VDAVWLSPAYLSPMRDGGYDIAELTAIDPRFGTLGDFGRLLAALHARGIRLILAFVPNHTSDRLPLESGLRSVPPSRPPVQPCCSCRAGAKARLRR
jgi:glycosidase